MPDLWPYVAFYLGLAGILTFEEAGVFFLPGDIALIAAGVYASQGGPLIFISWMVASLGMVLGSCVLFFTVRRSATSGRVLPVRVRDLIHRHGPLGVGVARMIPGLRNATVFAAAAANLAPYRFLFGLIPAAVAWSAILLAVGWFGGDTFLGMYGEVHDKAWIKALSIGLMLCGALFVAYRAWSTRHQEPAGAE